MKKILFFIIAALVISCNKDDEEINVVKDKWKLIEQLIDPGDGSGTYQKVDSDKTLIFYTDGKLACNTSLCGTNAGGAQPARGVYDSASSFIIPDACKTNKIKYKIDDGFLYLTFLCYEPCGEKYERIE